MCVYLSGERENETCAVEVINRSFRRHPDRGAWGGPGGGGRGPVIPSILTSPEHGTGKEKQDGRVEDRKLES